MAEPVYGASHLKPAESEAGAATMVVYASAPASSRDCRTAGDRGALLADRHVDAADLLLRVAGLPVRLLVDDGVDADRGLAGLAVTDDQLALAAADRGHGVDRLDAGLQRLAAPPAARPPRRACSSSAPLFLGLDVAQAVDRLPSGLTTRPRKRPRPAPTAPRRCA